MTLLRRVAILGACSFALAGYGIEVRADYQGRLGVEYDVHDYSGGAKDRTNEDILRSIFKHTIAFGTSGDLRPQKYGSYSFGMSLDGYYDRATNVAGSVSNYYAPDLKNLRGALSLLPRTRLPMSLSYTRQHLFSLDYEVKNRYVLTSERPSLAVVRKYETQGHDAGGDVALALNHAFNLHGFYQASGQQVSRLYDYGENRDLFVQVTPQQSPTTQSFYFVVFSNSLPETLTVYMDDTLLLMLPPANQQVVSISSGLHPFDLRAPSYNTFRTSYDVRANATWLIRYNPPASPNDRDASSNALLLVGLYEPNSRLRNELRVNDEKADDVVIATKTYNRLINNNLNYFVGDHTVIQSLSNYNRSGTEFTGQPEEVQSGFSQSSSIDYQPGERFGARFSHILNLLDNRGLQTTMHALEAGGFKQLTSRYTADLKLRGTRLTDSRNFSRRELNLATHHEYHEIDLGVATGAVRDQFELKTTSEFNPGRTQREYLNRIGLDTDFGQLGKIGDVRLTTEYSGRWFTDQSGKTFESRYTLRGGVLNNAWSRLKLSLLVSREASSVSGGGSQSGTSTSNLSANLQGNLELARGAAAQFAVMMVDQVELDIFKYHTSVNWVWPFVLVQHKLSFDDERKEYGLGDIEKYTTFSQQASFRWRRIEIVAVHEIITERVRAGRSRYQGFEIKAQRRFEL